ncbi:MAG: SMP-30/gluconolactonase/LRE family protein [Salinisphaera sp.]|nr:SMP-30/gluconolactonase/LRE family protein [Salinisphaera sp.]
MAAVTEMLRGWLPSGAGKAIPALDGPLAPNNLLDGLDRLELQAPDDLCAGPDGSLLVSSGPQLLRLDANGETPQTLGEFDAPITALARVNDDTIAVAVQQVGLLLVNPADGQVINQIKDCGGGDITALTADGQGGLYAAIGSTRHRAEDWFWDLMERNRSGQLIHWHPDRGDADVLADGLAWPNGLALAADGQALLVAQSWDHSLVRYSLPIRGAEKRATVIDNLPGYPARISAAAAGGYWLALFAMRTQLVELVLRENAFRQQMMREISPELWIRPALRSTGSHLEPLQGGGIKKLGIRKPWAPPRAYGLVLRLDRDCEPVASLHSRVDGQSHGITAALEAGGRLYIASKGHDALLHCDPARVTHR